MKFGWSPFGLKPTSDTNSGPRYADMYVRAVAASIDLALLFFLLNDLFALMTAKIYAGINRAQFNTAINEPVSGKAIALMVQSGVMHAMVINAVIQVFIIGVIYVGVQCLWGVTPGKYLLSLRVRRSKTFEAPSRWQFIVRFLAYIPAALPLMLGVLWASFNKERRGLHDYIAGTVVVHQHPEGWYWEQVKRGYRYLRNKRR